eukprot:gene570-biopygen308
MDARRIRLMPIFNVQRVHVRLDLKTLVNLFRHMFPKDPNIVELSKWDGVKDPDRFMLPEKPVSKKKKACGPDEWDTFKLAGQKYDADVAKIKDSEEYKCQKMRYDTFVKARKSVASSFFKTPPC